MGKALTRYWENQYAGSVGDFGRKAAYHAVKAEKLQEEWDALGPAGKAEAGGDFEVYRDGRLKVIRQTLEELKVRLGADKAHMMDAAQTAVDSGTKADYAGDFDTTIAQVTGYLVALPTAKQIEP